MTYFKDFIKSFAVVSVVLFLILFIINNFNLQFQGTVLGMFILFIPLVYYGNNALKSATDDLERGKARINLGYMTFITLTIFTVLFSIQEIPYKLGPTSDISYSSILTFILLSSFVILPATLILIWSGVRRIRLAAPHQEFLYNQKQRINYFAAIWFFTWLALSITMDISTLANNMLIISSTLFVILPGTAVLFLMGKEITVTEEIKSRLDGLKDKVRDLEQKTKELSRENINLQKESEKSSRENEGLRKNYNRIEKEKEHLESKIVNLNEKIKDLEIDLEDERRKSDPEVADLKRMIDGLKNEKRDIESRLRNSDKLRQSLALKMSNLEKDRKNLDIKIKDLEKENVTLKSRIKSLESKPHGSPEVDKLKENVKALRNENNNLKKEIKDLKTKSPDIRIKELEYEIYKLKKVLKIFYNCFGSVQKDLSQKPLYVNEIKKIRDNPDPKQATKLDVLVRDSKKEAPENVSLLSLEIEKRYYKHAFYDYLKDHVSKYSNNEKKEQLEREYMMLRQSYDPASYPNASGLRRNRSWATQRIFDLDESKRKIDNEL